MKKKQFLKRISCWNVLLGSCEMFLYHTCFTQTHESQILDLSPSDDARTGSHSKCKQTIWNANYACRTKWSWANSSTSSHWNDRSENQCEWYEAFHTRSQQPYKFREKRSAPTSLVTNHYSIWPPFRSLTNMAAVTSCENTLYRFSFVYADIPPGETCISFITKCVENGKTIYWDSQIACFGPALPRHCK